MDGLEPTYSVALLITKMSNKEVTQKVINYQAIEFKGFFCFVRVTSNKSNQITSILLKNYSFRI